MNYAIVMCDIYHAMFKHVFKCIIYTRSVEHDQDGQRPHGQEQRSSQRHHSLTDVADGPKKLSSTGQELNEINFVLMRENIEKMKRIRILKKVQSSFDNMFFRVQELTDGLKLQLDDVLTEHRKANKMVNRLHKHVSGMRGDLEGFQSDDGSILPNIERKPQRYTQVDLQAFLMCLKLTAQTKVR